MAKKSLTTSKDEPEILLSKESIKTVTTSCEEVVQAYLKAVEAALKDNDIETACAFWRAANSAFSSLAIFVTTHTGVKMEDYTKGSKINMAVEALSKRLDETLKVTA